MLLGFLTTDSCMIARRRVVAPEDDPPPVKRAPPASHRGADGSSSGRLAEMLRSQILTNLSDPDD